MARYFYSRNQKEEEKKTEQVKKPQEPGGSKVRILLASFWQVLVFVFYIFIYMLVAGVKAVADCRIFPKVLRDKLVSPLSRLYLKVTEILNSGRSGSIKRIDLIELSIRNMKAKKTRTVVTIGGMTIGIAAIVFLVSVGYGLQQMVVSRVARLEEMRQADISPQAGGLLKINDKTISDFKEVANVKAVLPLIAVVGRVSYQNSVTDLAVYGVTSDYLQESAIKPSSGKIFDSNEIVLSIDSNEVGMGEVYGTQTGEVGEYIQDVDFKINPNAWIRVRESPSTKAKILGFTRRVEGVQQGEEVWGDEYKDEKDQPKNKWLKSDVLLWKREDCDTTLSDCVGGKYLVLRDGQEKQIQTEGYFAEINLTLEGSNVVENNKVLGVTDSQALDWVEIASEAGILEDPGVKKVELLEVAKKQAVVNRAMLKVLGIKETEALGKQFEASFIVVGELLDDSSEKLESVPAQYTIIGITPEEKTPLFYVPFIDLRTLGITNYSQIKLVVKDSQDLAKTRKQVEAMGYVTHSVADTVTQINSLFGTAKTILALLGMVALSVAALGMFNTLTVSLLERTREVGLMKAMGMKSSEVQELFLTESMIMGLSGGILGILAGFGIGKLLGVVLSFFAVFKGVGFVDVAYIPFSFIFLVVFLSLFVGVATGIYPAKRATKISALNALRYE
jgi:ABC-type antimicrobial peptide transport system permease subunit